MQMQQPNETSWEEHVAQLDINIANAETSLLMAKAQRKEAESHIKGE